MLLTFGEAKNSTELAEVSGTCADSDKFRDLLNQATRKLMRRGNFFGTVQKIRVCTYDGCIVWPRWVGTILASNFCGKQAKGSSYWFEFLPLGGENWKEIMSLMRAGRCGGNLVLENSGTSPVSRNIPCGRLAYVRAYPSVKQDVGKTLTIFGIDENGQTIRQLVDGVWQEGYTLTLALNYAVTPFKVKWIDRVLKQKTQGPLRLYYHFSDNDDLLDAADYAPSETSPSMMTSEVHGRRPHNSCFCSSVDALVKLEFIPVETDNDVVLIENLDALQLMMFSARNQTNGDIAKARALEADAIRELNYGLRDKFPIEQFECSFNPFGTARLERVTGGFI